MVDVSALGAVTTKGVSLNGWEGNASPRIAEVPSGMLNSIGLQNPGVAHLKSEELPWLREQGATNHRNVSGIVLTNTCRSSKRSRMHPSMPTR